MYYNQPLLQLETAVVTQHILIKHAINIEYSATKQGENGKHHFNENTNKLLHSIIRPFHVTEIIMCI